jgi:hypothetical protein
MAPTTNSFALDNIADSLQKHLGIQQAQTFWTENATADAIARLVGTRGNIDRVLSLWDDLAEVGPKLVSGYEAASHLEPLRALRDVLDVSVVVQRHASGAPRSLLPYAPELITTKNVGTVFRDVGRTVVEGLWGGDGFDDEREQIRTRVLTWREAHPVADLLVPLCTAVTLEKSREASASNFATALGEDPALAQYRDTVVREDWRAWLSMAPHLSVDEQLESMTALISLHLHITTLRRLAAGETEADGVPPLLFAAAGPTEHRTIARGSYASYAFWRDRADRSLEIVVRRAVLQLAAQHSELKSALATPPNWVQARLWETLARGPKQTARQLNQFRELLGGRIEEASANKASAAQPVEIVVSSVAHALGGGVAEKVKAYLRTTGGGAGMIGGDTRKRYLLDERGLTLFTRLHAHRPAEAVRSSEEDHRSLAAFLDDIFGRYGIILTDEREVVQVARTKGGARGTALWRLMPGSDAMRANRELLDRRLDALRLVRRYSDASAVIHMPGGAA